MRSFKTVILPYPSKFNLCKRFNALSEIPPAGPGILKACSKTVIGAIFNIDQNLKEIAQKGLPADRPSF